MARTVASEVAAERSDALERMLERRLYGTAQEGVFELRPIAGRVPEGLHGRLLMNGPGRLAGGDLEAWRDTHWLDGDGLLTSIELDASSAESPGLIRQRLVDTQKLREERALGRRCFRRFGTAFPEDRLERGVGLVSPANVSVARIGPHLVACGEQGIPFEFDADTLETVGVFRAGGALTPVTPFAAHLRNDALTGEAFAFGVSFATRRPLLNLYRFANNGGLVSRSRVELPYAASVHDFALSKRFVHFYVAPYVLDMAALRDGATVLEALDWQPQLGSHWLVLSRQSGELVADVPLGEGYCLHLANAFEEGERITVDLVEYEAPLYPCYRLPRLYAEVPLGTPSRLTCDLSAPIPRVERRRIPTSGGAPDFPGTLPSRELRPTGSSWMVDLPRTADGKPSFFDRLVRVDWERQSCAQHRPGGGYLFAGEAAVAEMEPGNEEASWILAIVHFAPELVRDGGRSQSRPSPNTAEAETQLWIYPAFGIEDGPTARLALPDVPPRFHCLFEPAARSAIDRSS